MGRGAAEVPRRTQASRRPTSPTSTATRPTTTRRCSSRATRRRSSRRSTPATTPSSATRPGSGTPTRPADAFEQHLHQNDGKIDGVVSANDTMAGGIIARLKANGLAGKVPVTGQDASVEGLQRVLAGTQCMTVYKNTALEAKAASDLAIALIDQDEAAAPTSWPPGPCRTPRRVRTSSPRSPLRRRSSRTTSRRSIDDGFQTADDVCTGEFAAALRRGRHPVRRNALAHPRGVRPPLLAGRDTPAPDATQRAPRVHAPRPSRPPRRPAPARSCSCAAIQKSFGAVHVLRGVDFDDHTWPGHRAGRRQRRRQEHPDQGDRRHPRLRRG